jgi:hypothetical protein
LEHLDNAYKTKPKVDFAIYPAPDISPVIVEPYNSVLSIHGGMDYKSCCFVIDNQALYNICDRCDTLAISIVIRARGIDIINEIKRRKEKKKTGRNPRDRCARQSSPAFLNFVDSFFLEERFPKLFDSFL